MSEETKRANQKILLEQAENLKKYCTENSFVYAKITPLAQASAETAPQLEETAA